MSSQSIIINEVGPRDGLQSQTVELSLAQRQQFIEALLAAGLAHIEIGSFVSPRRYRRWPARASSRAASALQALRSSRPWCRI
jgi:isopropylmalate/homocitrate/citramalate synthase